MPDVINDTACKEMLRRGEVQPPVYQPEPAGIVGRDLVLPQPEKHSGCLTMNEFMCVNSVQQMHLKDKLTFICLAVSLPNELHSRADLQGFDQSLGSKHAHVVGLQTENA